MIKNISDNDFSYIIGFLQGDGNYYKQARNRGRVSIELSIRDKDILKKISCVLSGYNCFYSERIRNTNFKDNYTSCKLCIYDKEFRNNIEKFIPIGKKSNCIKPPINEKWFKRFDYMRGIIDADGSIGISTANRPFISLCTTSEYLKEFAVKLIYDNIGIEKRINRNKRDNAYNIVIFDEDALRFSNMLYNNSLLYLERKFREYNRIQQWIRTTPKRKGTKKRWLPFEDKLIMDNSYSLKEKSILLKRSKNSIKTRIWRNNSNNN